jgi:hypothetical protein
MSIKLGDTAPNFQAESSVGDINFYHYLGDSWGILIFSSGRLYAGLYYGTGIYGKAAV